jgi:hypothetical protein
VWPAVINGGSGELAFPPTHRIPIDSKFFFCSYDEKGESKRECTGAFDRARARAAALLEAEVDEAIATFRGDICAAFGATLVANLHLDAEVARLTRRNLNGLRARARMRKPPKP